MSLLNAHPTHRTVTGSFSPAVCVLLCILAAVTLAVSGCSETDKQPPAKKNSQKESCLTIGMLISASGLGDLGFMDMQYNGMIMACKKHNTDFVIEHLPEPERQADMDTGLERLAAQGSKIIFCTTMDMKMPMMNAARKHPEIFYILMDGALDTYPANTASASFKAGEAAYLGGFIAGSMSKTKSVGIICGTEDATIHEFTDAFSAGVHAACRTARIATRYIDRVEPDINPWSNPNTAVMLAESMHEKYKTDVFFSPSGASALGIYNYVKKHDLLAIGVDSDQDSFARGYIITSVMKRLDIATESLIDKFMNQKIENRNYMYDLANEGVGLSPMSFSRRILPEGLLAAVRQLRSGIVTGSINVPTTIAGQ